MLEELVSNTVRHGGPPVAVEVIRVDGGWLLGVSDAAVEHPPILATGRDPARGGLDLYRTAALSAARGWTLVGGRKHGWAHLTHCSQGAAEV